MSEEFKQWFCDVQMLYQAAYGMALDDSSACDWEDYFFEGCSPQDAVNDEAQYG